jgi:hypothetical protein
VSDTTRAAAAQFQLNPTDVGRRRENFELDDGTQPIVRIKRSATVFP